MSKEQLHELGKVLSCQKTSSEMRELLGDLLTDSEIQGLWQRWKIVEGLLLGIPQREIKEMAGVSISKVTRASQILKDGGKAFRKTFRKLHRQRRGNSK